MMRYFPGADAAAEPAVRSKGETAMAVKENVADWQMKRIALKCRGGKPVRRVNARALGKLAVHRTLGLVPPWVPPTSIWGVSHVPTGFLVTEYLSESAALKIVEDLQRLDWNFERPEDMPPNTKKQTPKIISRTKERRAASELAKTGASARTSVHD